MSAFSTNFLAELSVSDLMHEYNMTKIRIEEHAVHMHNELEAAIKVKSDAKSTGEKEGEKQAEDTRHSEHLHRYFLQRLKLKKKHIKSQLATVIKEHRIGGSWAAKTDENFFKAKK